MKVKLFTHTDLDGIGAVVVGKHAFGSSLEYECHNYDAIDAAVKRFLLGPQFDSTDAIFITDISVKDPEVIELINEKAAKKLMLIDHHKTAEGLNIHPWAKVDEYETVVQNGRLMKRLSSGTSAFYTYLTEKELLNETDELRDFVEQVRSYDSWDWSNVTPQNLTAKQLNDVYFMYGRFDFLKRFTNNPSVLFNKTEQTLLKMEEGRIQKTIYSKRKQLVKRKLELKMGTFFVGVVFAESYHSEIGNTLAKENPDLDFIILINGPDRMSFRGIYESIDLGLVAKEFGGGGHPRSAGAIISDETQRKLIDTALNI